MRLFLEQGSHTTLASGACAMELSSWLAGEPHSDHPHCVSPVIAAFMRRLNDRLNDDQRQELLPYCIRVIGTNSGKADDARRGFLCVDFAARVATPYWLAETGREDLKAHAARLRALPAIIDRATAIAARKPLQEAKRDAYAYAAAAAYAAADAAAYAYAYAAAAAYAAADAAAYAYAAAAAAADAAADAAAYAAADAYAYAAAAADARRRAWDALRAPTLTLLDAMIAIGEKETELVEERVTEYRTVCA